MRGRAVSDAPRFGSWLKAQRERAGLSWEGLARLLRSPLSPQRIHRSQIGYWEAGNVPDARQLRALADALTLSVEEMAQQLREELGADYTLPAPDIRLIHNKKTASIKDSPDRGESSSTAVLSGLRGALDDAAEKIAALESENADLRHRLDIVRTALAASVSRNIDHARAARTETESNRSHRSGRARRTRTSD